MSAGSADYVKPAADLTVGDRWAWCGRWLTVGAVHPSRRPGGRPARLISPVEIGVPSWLHYFDDEQVRVRERR